MARGNLFLGKARGKVGSVVFSRDKLTGQMITRAYQSQVANPKTASQVVQRAIFASCATAGSVLGDIVDHSFDGVTHGQESRNHFVSINTKEMTRLVAVNGSEFINRYIKPKGAQYIQPFQFTISTGKLGYLYFDNPVMGWFEDSRYGITIAELQAIFPELRAGSQLSFIGLYADTSTPSQTTYVIRKCRFVFNDLGFVDPTVKVAIEGNFNATYFDVERCLGVTYDSAANLLHCDLIHATEDPSNEFRFMRELPDFNGYLVGWAVVLTHYDSSKADPWVHSTSKMAIDLDAWDDTNDNIDTYASSNVNRIVSSEYYLDAAQPGGEQIELVTLEDIVAGVVMAQGMQEKTLRVGATQSYGPVAEGSIVYFNFNVPQGFRMSNVHIFNGESSLDNDWRIGVAQQGTLVSISGPMPTTASFAANISFDVYSLLNSSNVGRAAIRCTISKANS